MLYFGTLGDNTGNRWPWDSHHVTKHIMWPKLWHTSWPNCRDPAINQITNVSNGSVSESSRWDYRSEIGQINDKLMWKVRSYNFWNQGDISVDLSVINLNKWFWDKNVRFLSKITDNCMIPYDSQILKFSYLITLLFWSKLTIFEVMQTEKGQFSTEIGRFYLKYIHLGSF